MLETKVVIHGLRDVRSALAKVDAAAPAALRRALKEEVAEPAAGRIRARVPVGPGAGGHWRSEIKAGATARGAHVTWGRSARPYAGWVEFGGTLRHHDHSGRPTGVTITRPRVAGGRYVYPVIKQYQPEALEAAAGVIDRLATRAGLT